MKLQNVLGVFILGFLLFWSCRNDDDNGVVTVPPRDQAEQYQVDNDSIVEFLQTHFYNYEDFENPPADFNYEIVFDTIAGANVDKTPLMNQVQTKVVKTDEVDFNLYYLGTEKKGNGPAIKVTDSTFVTYKGTLLNNHQFDAAVSPIWFDLTSTVRGFSTGFVNYTAGDGVATVNNDGTVSFTDFTVGAIFLPSGLGYFASAVGSAPAYSPLTFTFKIFSHNETDHDQDGIPSYLEDLDGNENPFDDNTDGDNLPNYSDVDDDGDGVFTRADIVINGDGTITYPDTDNDGTPDYLDNK